MSRKHAAAGLRRSGEALPGSRRQNDPKNAIGPAIGPLAAAVRYLIEIQHSPWAPTYLKQLRDDGTFTVTYAPGEALAFPDQDAETLALVAAEVATWPLKPGPVLYVLKGI